MGQKTQLINMFILAIAIILVCSARSKFSELFVAQVPLPPQYQGYGAQGDPGQIMGGHPQGNPYQYPNQIYPARIPYYTEMGRPCDSIQSCGSMGKCENGKCNAIPYEKSVFNVVT